MSAVLRSQPAEEHLSSRNFTLLSKFIYDYSGIKMPVTKVTMLEGRLRKRLRALGMESFNEYCDYVFSPEGQETEVTLLIDCVTTNKTDFFREPNHFDYMAETVLPQLAADGHRRLRAWSAACSTGAEPYTMAMVMADFALHKGGPDFTILATDLSTEVLETAHSGIYSQDMLAPVPPALKSRYVMLPVDKRRKDARITPQLRSRVGFARFNLMDRTYRVGEPMHLIMCRNVLIYFDKATQTHVLTELCNCLLPGGYLFIGHSESATGIDLPLTQVANTVFRKN